MSDPYEIIADRFEELFPCPDGAPPYVVSALSGERPDRRRVLDIGCATGELDRRLAAEGIDVVAIDTSETMIRRARDKWADNPSGGSIRFDVMDMRTIGSEFAPESFDAILCLGNTLPHLESVKSIRDAIGEMAGLLGPRGALILQLLDYEGVQPGESWSMAPVEIPRLRFERSVKVRAEAIEFTITVVEQESGKSASATQRLVPVSRGQIESIAVECGLSIEALVAGFDDPRPPAARSSYVMRLAKRA